MANFKYYEKDGKQYERVSNILNVYTPEGIIDWKLRVGKREANRVGNLALKEGTRIHQLCEDDWKTGEVNLYSKDSQNVRNCFEAWGKWRADHQVEIVEMERQLFHPTMGFAGTVDIITDTMIIDIKSSKKISITYWLQLAAYSMMYGKQMELWVLRLGKMTGVYEFVKCPYEYDYLVTVFTSMVNLFNYYKED